MQNQALYEAERLQVQLHEHAKSDQRHSWKANLSITFPYQV